MTRSEKIFLWFGGIAMVGGVWMWIMDYDDQTKLTVAATATALYFLYTVLHEFSVIKRQNDLIFDLLWKMSFREGIDDDERQEIREQIAALEKDRK